jgi:multidrug resistance efflux pump
VIASRWIILPVVFSALGAGAVALLSSGNKPDHASAPAASVSASAAGVVHGFGYAEPASELRRLNLKVDGVIAECSVAVGERVEKGTPLLHLDNEEEQTAVAVAQKELDQARAALRQVMAGVNPFRIESAERECDRLTELLRHAERVLHRRHLLAAKQIASQQDLEDAETQVTQAKAALASQEAELLHLRQYVREEDRGLAEANVELAETRLTAAEKRLRLTVLVAPCDGTVLELYKREGDCLRMGDPQPAVLFGDVARLRIRAEIDERYAHRVRDGQSAVVFGPNVGNREYAGRVVMVKPVMGDKTLFSRSSRERKDLQVVQVLIEMDPEFRTPVGLRVDVAIRVEE